MLSINQLFFNLLLPAIVCGGIFAAVAYINKKNENKKHLQWLTATALGIGYIVGYIGIEGKPTFLPKESIHWLFYFTILAILGSTYWDSTRWRRLITQLIYSVAIPRLLLNSYFQHIWGPIEGIIWWICLAIGVYIFWNIVLLSFSALPAGASVPFVYLGVSGGTALIIALSGSIVIAQHAGILVALFAAIWISTIILYRSGKNGDEYNFQIFSDSVSPMVTFLFGCIWINGYFYAEVPSASALLLVIVPIFAQVGRIKVIQRLGVRKSVLAQIGLIALCTSIAIIIAVVRSGFFGEDAY